MAEGGDTLESRPLLWQETPEVVEQALEIYFDFLDRKAIDPEVLCDPEAYAVLEANGLLGFDNQADGK